MNTTAADFIAAHVAAGDERERIAHAALYALYRDWCMTSGLWPANSRAFREAMRATPYQGRGELVDTPNQEVFGLFYRAIRCSYRMTRAPAQNPRSGIAQDGKH